MKDNLKMMIKMVMEHKKTQKRVKFLKGSFGTDKDIKGSLKNKTHQKYRLIPNENQ
jgi:hypothetical protein